MVKNIVKEWEYIICISLMFVGLVSSIFSAGDTLVEIDDSIIFGTGFIGYLLLEIRDEIRDLK